MDNLPGLLSFVRVAEVGSFVGAANLLGLSPSAVGKNVARLESALGARLFERSTRRVALTDVGELFLERCQRALAELQDAKGLVLQMTGDPRGRLRVSLPTIGYHFLMPHMAEFRRLHPAIDLHLDFSDRQVDVIGERMDVAIRSGAQRDSELKSRCIGGFRFMICASPSYLEGQGAIAMSGQLRGLAALRFQHPSTGRIQPWLLEHREEPLAGLHDAVVANNMEALVYAALSGMGLLYGPDFLLQRYVDRGDLVEVRRKERLLAGKFWAVWASGAGTLPKIRAFVDFSASRLLKSPHATV
jgi:DNA-binding transcriptional LysR family regulator